MRIGADDEQREAAIPEGWVPLYHAVQFVTANFAYKNPRFILDNWDYKYTHIRVDMRTGMALIIPGNKRTQE